MSYDKKGVDVYSIASICVGAIQKLQNEISTLAEENTKLYDCLEKLEQRINILERK